jgi:hypothetical protein
MPGLYKITDNEEDPFDLGATGEAAAGTFGGSEVLRPAGDADASGSFASFMRQIQPFLAGDEADMKRLSEERRAVSTEPDPKKYLLGAGIITALSLLGGKRGVSGLGSSLNAYQGASQELASRQAANKASALNFDRELLGSELNSKRGIMRDIARVLTHAKVGEMFPGKASTNKLPSDIQVLQYLMANPKDVPKYKALKIMQNLFNWEKYGSAQKDFFGKDVDPTAAAGESERVLMGRKKRPTAPPQEVIAQILKQKGGDYTGSYLLADPDGNKLTAVFQKGRFTGWK